MGLMNRKFDALRRLATLIEDASDPKTMFPNLDAMLPLSDINLSTYEHIRNSCPFLNLPPGQAGVDALRGRVNDAYNALLNELSSHPWSKLDRIQRMMDRFHGKHSLDLQKIKGVLNCSEVLCGTVESFPGQLVEQQRTVDKWTENFVTHEGQVLTDGMKEKKQQINDLAASVKQLQQ